MSRDPKASFQNSGLGRAKPKTHKFKAFINGNLKQQKTLRSQVGLVEDSTSPVTVLRVILGLIVVHFLVIGGVMMRGSITKSGSGLVVAPTIVPPPVAPADPAPQVQPAQPQPAVAVQPAEPAATPADTTEVHITQAPINVENVTPVASEPAAPVEPVAIQPTPAPAPAPADVVPLSHLVKTGDTWGRVAAQYGITEDVLKGANASLANRHNLPTGVKLSVPVPKDSAVAKEALANQPVVKDTAKYHVVKSGENPGRIAKKYKISVNKLLKMNNMTNADAKRLRVGQKLKVSE